MIRDFSREELEPVSQRNETELTLGGGTLLGLAGGLLLLCGVCFAIGYAVGHRASPDESAAAVTPSSSLKMPAAPSGSGSKPGAATQAPQAGGQVTADGASASNANVQTEEAADTSDSSGQRAVKSGTDPQVRPALGGQGTAPLHVQPATTQVQGWMVQIAAVSHAEDAAVLVDALRKRGYAVTARRDVGDNMIHVQTGPFVSRNDANAMRQKLLNDGYNAIVQ
jgi:DedD protein